MHHAFVATAAHFHRWQLSFGLLDQTLPTYNACISAVGAAWQVALGLLEELEAGQRWVTL